MTTVDLRRHPAPWNRDVLAVAAAWLDAEADDLGRPVRVLDPFAGVGRIHEIGHGAVETVGLELEPEWAAWHPRTVVGDARRPPFAKHYFDAICTSACYGNRFADAHDAKDACATCRGAGEVPGDDSDGAGLVPCPACGGEGLSQRHSYRAYLHRKPTDGSAAVMQWGTRYRSFHAECVQHWKRVLRPGGLLMVNMKNHVRHKRVQPVVEWWLQMMLGEGYTLEDVERIGTRGRRHGANHAARVDGEFLFVTRRP